MNFTRRLGSFGALLDCPGSHLGLSGSQIGNKTEKLVTGRNEPVKTRFLEPDFFKKAFCSSRSREAISASISAQTGTTPAPSSAAIFFDGLIMLVLLEISRNLVLAHVAGINNRLSEMRATSLSSCRRPRRGQMNGRFFRFQGGHKEPLKGQPPWQAICRPSSSFVSRSIRRSSISISAKISSRFMVSMSLAGSTEPSTWTMSSFSKQRTT